MKKLKIIFCTIALAIFLVHTFQSLEKYFQYPVVFQESFVSSSMIEKQFTQIYFKHFFNSKKNNSEFGYNFISSFLAGLIPKSARPTWKGKYGN